MMMQPDTALPPEVFDTALRRTPVNVFVFDTDLICRYAAPVGDSFLGQPREQLTGRPAAEFWPPAANGLRPVLQRAAREAERWENDTYHFVHGTGAEERACCWSIQIEPVAVDGFRGVLVSTADVLQAAADRHELEQLREEQRERNEALLAAVSDLRNLITPLSGYLQLIARRPDSLGKRSPAEVISSMVLPQVRIILDTVDRLRHPPIYQ